MDQLFLARRTLEQVIRRSPTAPAWHLLALTARREKNWDAMETAAWQATRLDPGNPDYRELFDTARNHRQKANRAAIN